MGASVTHKRPMRQSGGTNYRLLQGNNHVGGKRLSSSLWCLLVLSLTDVAGAFNFPEIDATEFGHEIATLTDGGAFGRPDVSHRQEFCQRYQEMAQHGRNSQGNGRALDNALSGRQIHLSINPGPYFIYDDVNGIDPTYPGIHARMLDYIAQRGNFTWRQSFGVWTREEKGNRSITDLLVWGTEKYDVMVGTYTPSAGRMRRGVSFIDGHFDGSLVMVRDVPPPEEEIGWFNWLRPFEPAVWIVLFLTVIFSSFAYQVIEHIGRARYQDHGEKSFRSWTMTNLYMSFLNFTANYAYEPTTLGGRVFGVCFAFWAMLITAAYTANLASLLVVRAAPEPAVGDVQSAIDQRFKICVHGTSFSETYLTEQYPGIEPLLVRKPVKELYDALNGGKCELMVSYKQDFETALRHREDNPTCTLQWQGRKIKPLLDGFATKLDPAVLCTDLVNEVFNFYVKEMTDNGYLEHVWQEHINYYADEGHCENATPSSSNGSGRGMLASSTLRSSNGRRLKGAAGRGGAAGGAAAAAAEGGGGDDSASRLSLKDMAGTVLFQIIATSVAVLVAFVSGWEKKTKAKRRKRQSERSALDLSESEETTSVQEELQDLKQQMGHLIVMMQRLQDNLDQNTNKSSSIAAIPSHHTKDRRHSAASIDRTATESSESNSNGESNSVSKPNPHSPRRPWWAGACFHVPPVAEEEDTFAEAISELSFISIGRLDTLEKVRRRTSN